LAFFSFSFFKNEIVGFIFNLFSKWVNYFSVIEPRAPSVSIYFRPNWIYYGKIEQQLGTDLFQSSIKSSNFFAGEISSVANFVQTQPQSNLLVLLAVAHFGDVGFAAEVHIGEIEYARLFAAAVAEARHDQQKYHLLIVNRK
jgi:hypothetical protein